MNKLALTLRNCYKPLTKEKIAQVEANIASGEATPTHNKLKVSPAATGAAGPPPKGPAPAPMAQASASPQANVPPPAPVPSTTQPQGAGIQNPQPTPPPQQGVPPTTRTSVLNSSPTRSSKGRSKAAQADIEKIKKLAGVLDNLSDASGNILGAMGTGLHGAIQGFRSLPIVSSLPLIGTSRAKAQRAHTNYDTVGGFRAPAASTNSATPQQPTAYAQSERARFEAAQRKMDEEKKSRKPAMSQWASPKAKNPTSSITTKAPRTTAKPKPSAKPKQEAPLSG